MEGIKPESAFRRYVKERDKKLQMAMIEDLDEKLIAQDLFNSTNTLISRLRMLVSLQVKVFLYRIIRKKYMNMDQLEEVTGITRQQLYRLMREFEERELDRRNTKDQYES